MQTLPFLPRLPPTGLPRLPPRAVISTRLLAQLSTAPGLTRPTSALGLTRPTSAPGLHRSANAAVDERIAATRAKAATQASLAARACSYSMSTHGTLWRVRFVAPGPPGGPASFVRWRVLCAPLAVCSGVLRTQQRNYSGGARRGSGVCRVAFWPHFYAARCCWSQGCMVVWYVA